jgi:hypothetical protein
MDLGTTRSHILSPKGAQHSFLILCSFVITAYQLAQYFPFSRVGTHLVTCQGLDTGIGFHEAYNP